jgi:Protein of unknown function (DUF4199)
MLDKPAYKYPLFYGFIASICCFLFLVILHKVFNINPLGGKKEVSIIFLIVGMALAVSAVRKANGGGLDFGSAFRICIFTTIISCFFSLLFLFIFLNYISPNVLPDYINTTTIELAKNKIQIIANGISETDFNDAYSNIKGTSVKTILIDDFIKKIFLSIVPSLMISLYFRRRFIN